MDEGALVLALGHHRVQDPLHVLQRPSQPTGQSPVACLLSVVRVLGGWGGGNPSFWVPSNLSVCPSPRVSCPLRCQQTPPPSSFPTTPQRRVLPFPLLPHMETPNRAEWKSTVKIKQNGFQRLRFRFLRSILQLPTQPILSFPSCVPLGPGEATGPDGALSTEKKYTDEERLKNTVASLMVHCFLQPKDDIVIKEKISV